MANNAKNVANQQPVEPEQKSSGMLRWIIIIVVVVLVGGVLIYIFTRSETPLEITNQTVNTNSEEAVVLPTTKVAFSTLPSAAMSADSGFSGSYILRTQRNGPTRSPGKVLPLSPLS